MCAEQVDDIVTPKMRVKLRIVNFYPIEKSILKIIIKFNDENSVSFFFLLGGFINHVCLLWPSKNTSIDCWKRQSNPLTQVEGIKIERQNMAFLSTNSFKYEA